MVLMYHNHIFQIEGEDTMKNSTRFLLGAAAGAGMLALYKKYSPTVMNDIKRSVNKMSREASKSIENMM